MEVADQWQTTGGFRWKCVVGAMSGGSPRSYTKESIEKEEKGEGCRYDVSKFHLWWA